MSTVLLSRIHHPVTNLGFGVRVGIWLQGCTIGCLGCVSRDTWPTVESSCTTVRSITDTVNTHLDGLDGVTISGGEPTDQPAGLQELLTGLRDLIGPDRDILVYTGRSLSEACGRVPALRAVADVVISEPFVAGLADDSALRGSSNQVVSPMSSLGTQRYPADGVEDAYADQRHQIGIHVDEGTLRLVGIPRRGDMARLSRRLKTAGIGFDEASWLS